MTGRSKTLTIGLQRRGDAGVHVGGGNCRPSDSRTRGIRHCAGDAGGDTGKGGNRTEESQGQSDAKN